MGEGVLVHKDPVLGLGEEKGLGGECGQMKEGKDSQGKQTHFISGWNSAPTHKSWMACEWKIREGGQKSRLGGGEGVCQATLCLTVPLAACHCLPAGCDGHRI